MESITLSYFHGCMSGIGIAAVCKIVASAFLVRIQVYPLYAKYKRKLVNRLASRLSIEEERLKVGQVRTIKSNNGKKIDSITLLLSNNVEVLFVPKNNGTLEFTISDPNIDMSNLDCTINEDVLYDLTIQIKNAYNQVVSNEREEQET